MGTEVSKAGRPSKYNAAIQSQAEDYVLNWSERDKVPSRAGLCCYIGIAKSTSFEWEAIHPAFSDVLSAIEVLQESELVNNGLSGVFNSTITKMMMTKHGYSDKQEIDHTTAGESLNPPRIEIVAVDVDTDPAD